jgi:hypothetical protein
MLMVKNSANDTANTIVINPMKNKIAHRFERSSATSWSAIFAKLSESESPRIASFAPIYAKFGLSPLFFIAP